VSWINNIVQAIGGTANAVIGGNAAMNAAHEQENALLAAQNTINDTTTQNQNYVQGASSAAQSGVAGAVQNGQDLVGNGAQYANSISQGSLDQIKAGYSPYTSAGSTAVNELGQLTNGSGVLGSKFSAPTLDDMKNNPGNAGYQFTLAQGQQAIQRAAAAQGGLYNTGTAKSLAGYTTGAANQFYNTAFNQSLSAFQANQQSALNQANVLNSLSGQGLSAQGQVGNAQLQTGFQQGQNLTNAAQVQSSLGMGGAQYIGNTGLGRAEFNANLGNTGAMEATNYGVDAANALAQATLARGKMWQGIVSSNVNTMPDIGSLGAGGGGG
jgi:hypothetical protein